MNKSIDAWERVLDPEVLRPALLSATMFITAFEILKDCVVDRVRNFYTLASGEKNATTPEYEREVLSRDKKKRPLAASLDWLYEHKAINDADLRTFERLNDIRNQLAHELFSVITGQVSSDYSSQFSELFGLIRKIEVWWIVNVEIPTNPDYDGEDVNEESIMPGALLSLQMLMEVALGNTELLEQWQKIQSCNLRT